MLNLIDANPQERSRLSLPQPAARRSRIPFRLRRLFSLMMLMLRVDLLGRRRRTARAIAAAMAPPPSVSSRRAAIAAKVRSSRQLRRQRAHRRLARRARRLEAREPRADSAGGNARERASAASIDAAATPARLSSACWRGSRPKVQLGTPIERGLQRLHLDRSRGPQASAGATRAAREDGHSTRIRLRRRSRRSQAGAPRRRIAAPRGMPPF